MHYEILVYYHRFKMENKEISAPPHSREKKGFQSLIMQDKKCLSHS
jgi:hypothetical protein